MKACWSARVFMQTSSRSVTTEPKHATVAASGEETVRTSVFDTVCGYSWPDGITGRALHNDFTARWRGREREPVEWLGASDNGVNRLPR